jgi:UDP-N-acetyl-D-mannosaminuronic acid dehydrogenase
VLGLGYVGLPTASLLATQGFRVTGVDVDPAVLERIRRGKGTSVEPDLDVLVKSALQSGHLMLSGTPEEAGIYLLAVPTPLGTDRKPDLSCVWSAAQAIVRLLKKDDLVIVESTCPVGTTEDLGRWFRQQRPDLSVSDGIRLAYCPERVLPGGILRELVGNVRVVGGIDPPSTERAREFYGRFVHAQILATSARTAEMVKLAENSFRDVNIAFANELAAICEKWGTDVREVIGLANRHPRVQILRPGVGVGGHCVAVDPWFLVHAAAGEARLMETARQVNDARPSRIAARIKAEAVSLGIPRIACLGLAYKADVDDLRESPALEVVRRLTSERVGEIWVVEPHIEALPEPLRRAGVKKAGLREALDACELVVWLVNHRAFAEVDPTLLAGKRIVDACGRSSCAAS